eukprot:CAMPEP_0197555576 /NCGR_PEP_ID=MMETSP1320-20131121/13558_1 /TAXON_ID=91990 /ORGANISM="Bolidomonas sp., Strain RCC2347" /LENGTH=142 /DNA_ID=CAMNT_0043116607 /DNA_START=93 /DNA_END=518 /DNA_ORIENTATION=+
MATSLSSSSDTSSNLADPSHLLNIFLKLCTRQSNLLVTLTNTSSVRTHLRHDGELTKVNGGESFLTTVPGLLKLLEGGKAEEEEGLRARSSTVRSDLRSLVEESEARAYPFSTMIRARMELGERVSAAVEDNASSHDVKTVA